MSLKNLLVGLLYRYKLVKQAVLNEYVKEARQRQLQYQQRIQQLINLHKADSLVKKANLISNLYQQALLAKLAAEDEAIRGSGNALMGLIGGPGSVLGGGGMDEASSPRLVEVGKGGGGAVVDMLKGVLSGITSGSQRVRQALRSAKGGIVGDDELKDGRGGGGFFSETAKAVEENANKNQGGLAGPIGSSGDSNQPNDGSGGIAVAPPSGPVEVGKGGGGFGKLLMTAAKKELEKQRGGGNSGWWSEVLNALNEHKGQIALGAGGGLLALLGGALLAKKLRNRKKKNTAQTPSSDAAAAATAVEQELKDLITSTQKQQKKK